MKAGSFAVFAPLMLLGECLAGRRATAATPAATAAAAGHTAPPAPAALSVPNPFAGFHPGPRDLYRSPDGSDRFQHLSHYPASPPPIVSYPGRRIFPAAYYSVRLRLPAPYYETSLAETYRCRWRRPICGASAKPRAVAWCCRRCPPWRRCSSMDITSDSQRSSGLGGRAMRLVAGAHRIELRAPGLRNAHVQRHDRTERPRALSRRHAADRTKPPAVIAPSQPTAGEKLLRHPELLRRRQAAHRNAAQGLRSEETANAEIGQRRVTY